MKKINTMDIKKVLEKMGNVNVITLNTLMLTFKDKKYYNWWGKPKHNIRLFIFKIISKKDE